MRTELGVTAIAARLTAQGYPICRHWLAILCKQGKGPPYRVGPLMFGRPQVIIHIADAERWAKARWPTPPDRPIRVQKVHYVTITEEANAIDDMMAPILEPTNGEYPLDQTTEASELRIYDPPVELRIYDPQTALRSELPLIADTIAYRVRTADPENWQKFLKLKGQARRDRLNQVTAEILKIAAKRLAAR